MDHFIIMVVFIFYSWCQWGSLPRHTSLQPRRSLQVLCDGALWHLPSGRGSPAEWLMTRHAVTCRVACECFIVLLMNLLRLHLGGCQIRSVSVSCYQVEWKIFRAPERIAGTEEAPWPRRWSQEGFEEVVEKSCYFNLIFNVLEEKEVEQIN